MTSNQGYADSAIVGSPGAAYGDALLAALKTQSFESPRGPISIDPQTREVIQNIYTRKVERVPAMGNQLFNVGKNFVAATNGLHYALAYDELTGPLDKAVDSGTKLFYDNVYVKWFGLVALLLAVWLFKHIWTGDLATVSKRGMWALASMWVATSFLLIGPSYKQIEGQFLDRTTRHRCKEYERLRG